MKSRRFTWGMGLLLRAVFRTPLHPRLQNLLAQLRCLTMPNDQVAKTTGLTIAPHHSQWWFSSLYRHDAFACSLCPEN
jgi:hypothetical protein